MRLPKVLRRLKPLVAHQLEMFLLWYYSATAKQRRPKHETGRILLARTDGLGDFIIWLSCAQKFRELYPDKKIVVMLDSIKPTLELVQEMPQWFDEVFNIDIHNYTRFFEFRKMQKMEFDLLIQPAYSRVAFTDILVFACKAGKRITLDTNAKFLSRTQLKWTNRGYDQIIPASSGIKHELIRCGELIRGLGDESFQVGFPDLREDNSNKGHYFVGFPAASGPTKIWEPEKYARVLDAIIEKSGWDCILSGGQADSVLIEEVISNMKHAETVKNYAGCCSLAQTIHLLNGSRMAIGNDTGAMHMSVACRLPSVVLMGDNELGRFFPYTCEKDEKLPLWVVDANLECKGCNAMKDVPCKYPFGERGTYYCIASITVEKCMEAVNQCLEWVRKNER